ncbi:MAG TPA: hypothetical protein VD699_01835 [Nitrosopumilaceae archaeon]|nr:hypothetical protein [Nitrosopumilaceae archaeon]HXV38304.1 hypothetical protein [Nitrosopumilaceae archaeon]
MNVEWIVTGVFLFGGMTAAAISLYVKRRKESRTVSDSFTQIQPDMADIKGNDDEK